jgi:hypothetical protein
VSRKKWKMMNYKHIRNIAIVRSPKIKNNIKMTIKARQRVREGNKIAMVEIFIETLWERN